MLSVLAAVALYLSAAPLAGPDFKRLYSDQASASSYLQNDWNKYQQNYHPNYALDDDPATAWVEGANGDGVGESLTVRVSPLTSARAVRLRIRNGYQKSKPLFAANAAPKEVELALLDPTGTVVVTQKVTLSRTLGWQDFNLAMPPNKGFGFARIALASTYPGTRYKDTCLSDLQIWVDSDVTYNPKAEEAKSTALKAWIRERVEAAKYFAALPSEYPFASTHFEGRPVSNQTELQWDKLGVPIEDRKKIESFVPLEQAVASKKYSPAWKSLFSDQETETIQKLIATTTRGSAPVQWNSVAFNRQVRLPDGLDFDLLRESANFFDRSGFALFEAASEMAPTKPISSMPHPGYLKELKRSNLIVRYAPAPKVTLETGPRPVNPKGLVEEIYFWEYRVFSERQIYTTKTDYLLCMDDLERPRELVAIQKEDEGWQVQLFTFERDSGGRISRVVTKNATSSRIESEDVADQNSFSMHEFTPKV